MLAGKKNQVDVLFVKYLYSEYSLWIFVFTVQVNSSFLVALASHTIWFSQRNPFVWLKKTPKPKKHSPPPPPKSRNFIDYLWSSSCSEVRLFMTTGISYTTGTIQSTRVLLSAINLLLKFPLGIQWRMFDFFPLALKKFPLSIILNIIECNARNYCSGSAKNTSD